MGPDANTLFAERILTSFPEFAAMEVNSLFEDLPYVILGNFALYLNGGEHGADVYEKVNDVFNRGIKDSGGGITNLILTGFLEVLADHRITFSKLREHAGGDFKKLFLSWNSTGKRTFRVPGNLNIAIIFLYIHPGGTQLHKKNICM